MQLGGNDQWSNILGGVTLSGRKGNKPAYGMTFQLLTNKRRQKMGKTEKAPYGLIPKNFSLMSFTSTGET